MKRLREIKCHIMSLFSIDNFSWFFWVIIHMMLVVPVFLFYSFILSNIYLINLHHDPLRSLFFHFLIVILIVFWGLKYLSQFFHEYLEGLYTCFSYPKFEETFCEHVEEGQQNYGRQKFVSTFFKRMRFLQW